MLHNIRENYPYRWNILGKSSQATEKNFQNIIQS